MNSYLKLGLLSQHKTPYHSMVSFSHTEPSVVGTNDYLLAICKDCNVSVLDAEFTFLYFSINLRQLVLDEAYFNLMSVK